MSSESVANESHRSDRTIKTKWISGWCFIATCFQFASHYNPQQCIILNQTFDMNCCFFVCFLCYYTVLYSSTTQLTMVSTTSNTRSSQVSMLSDVLTITATYYRIHWGWICFHLIIALNIFRKWRTRTDSHKPRPFQTCSGVRAISNSADFRRCFKRKMSTSWIWKSMYLSSNIIFFNYLNV